MWSLSKGFGPELKHSLLYGHKSGDENQRMIQAEPGEANEEGIGFQAVGTVHRNERR